MKLNKQNHVDNPQGFTLVEVIVALIVVAILGTMLFTFTDSSIRGSAQPVQAIQTTYGLEQAMENINMTYMHYYYGNTCTSALVPLATFITANYSAGSGVVGSTIRYASYTGSDLGAEDTSGPIMRVTLTATLPSDPSLTTSLSALFFEK